jgi:hypothetical protein
MSLAFGGGLPVMTYTPSAAATPADVLAQLVARVVINVFAVMRHVDDLTDNHSAGAAWNTGFHNRYDARNRY